MAYTVCHAPLELLVRLYHTSGNTATMELQTGVLSTLTQCVTLKSVHILINMTS